MISVFFCKSDRAAQAGFAGSIERGAFGIGGKHIDFLQNALDTMMEHKVIIDCHVRILTAHEGVIVYDGLFIFIVLRLLGRG